MRLHALHLRNFRLYEEATFAFAPGINLLVGPNATGKTTVLEAIEYLMTGRSFRSRHPRDLVRQGSEFFSILLDFSKEGIRQRLQVMSDGRRRRIFHNQTKSTSTTALLGILQGTLMTPDDAQLIKGGPQYRRRYLDIQLAQVDPLYVHHLRRYQRGMQQRNALLKRREEGTVAIWEREMAVSAAYIVRERNRLVRDLIPRAERVYLGLAPQSARLALSYLGKSGEEAYFVQAYARHRQRDMKFGFTSVGPHKDDCAILLGGKEARLFGSEGEQRSCVAALRLAEWERMQEETGRAPLMLVDDMKMGLDAARQDRLIASLLSMDQVLITATDRVESLRDKTAIIETVFAT